MDARKYIVNDNVLHYNPAYHAQSNEYVPNSPQAIAYTSSMQDIEAAKAAGYNVQLTPATQTALEQIKADDYLASIGEIKKPKQDPALALINETFTRHGIPLTMLPKYLQLTDKTLHWIIDDSGSMSHRSDVYWKDAGDELKKQRCDELKTRKKPKDFDPNQLMTRWQEAQNRLHVMINILSCLPIKKIKISFLNRHNKIELSRGKLSPEKFRKTMHEKIQHAFQKAPDGNTPIYKELQEAFKHKQITYLATDGEPSGATTEEVSNLIIGRTEPALHPLSLWSCTNDTKQSAWMKAVEKDEDAENVSESDDLNSETAEVNKEQGIGFYYTEGLWYTCQLLAAINPDDLDLIDEGKLFSKLIFNELMGRVVSQQEYQYYFLNHPKHEKHIGQYAQLAADGFTQVLPLPMPQATVASPGGMGFFAQGQQPMPMQYPAMSQQPTNNGFTPQ